MSRRGVPEQKAGVLEAVQAHVLPEGEEEANEEAGITWRCEGDVIVVEGKKGIRYHCQQEAGILETVQARVLP